ncbi:hypothetical protein BC834DRAFT_1034935 [Gloeopeniophorella convolvens]|nr:hypothetical protein BC834DRAFT_1034935 [Gloeopeniophorella convolvens]
MLSLTLRRVVLQPRALVSQGTQARVALRAQPPAWSIPRGFATTKTESGSHTKSEKKSKDSEAKPKEKKVTIRREDLPPKAPGSSYVMWVSDWLRSQPKAENLEGAQTAIKRAAELWKAAPEHEKQEQAYREKYAAVRAEYLQKLEEWRQRVSPEVLRELNRKRVSRGKGRIRSASNASEGSTRPMGAFFLFAKDVRESSGEIENYRQFMSELSGKWKELSDAERAKYTEAARAAMAAWHASKDGSQSA